MANTYNVEILHKGETHKLTVSEGENLLEAALNAGIDLPYSCSAGVCTTCAGRILEGEIEQDGMGLSPELQGEGFALLCAATAKSDLKIESNQEEKVYDRQFGRA